MVKNLPASKSISNRALIIQALSGVQSKLENLSEANDTVLMRSKINSAETVIDVQDAGTTMRFLTAYFAITNQQKILTGTSRMKERPIGILVDALRTLGVSIEYTEREGFPPIQLKGLKTQLTDHLTVRGDVSSQFISALMMVAPLLSKGLTLTLTGKIGSRPYFEMTANLMQKFGAVCEIDENRIQVRPGGYKPGHLFVESDWSGASYWFAFTALAEQGVIQLPHLFPDSLQGDRVITEIMNTLGVSSNFTGDGVSLSKQTSTANLVCDFTHCPDLAQTVAVVCATKRVNGIFTGLESLRIKETDRIGALQTELAKLGASLREEDSTWRLVPSQALPESVFVNTYKDHRMAMAFAPLACLMEVTIENPEVVKKSYPRFWEDVREMGFAVR